MRIELGDHHDSDHLIEPPSAAILSALALLVLVGAGMPTSAAAVDATWSPYPIYRGEMTAIAEDPSDADNFYVGTRGAGVFRSTDAGLTWTERREGLPASVIMSLAVDPESSAIALAGTDGDGIWRTLDGGLTWSATSGVESGVEVRNIVFDVVDSDIVYAGVASFSAGNVYRSSNGGVSWTVQDDGMPGSAGSHTDDVLALALDAATIYAATSSFGVYHSTNGGVLWTALSTGLPNDGGDFEAVSALAVSPHDQQPWAVVPGFERGLYRLNETDTWIRVSTGTTGTELTGGDHLDFMPDDPNHLFASGGLGGSAETSTDGGATWSRSLGFPDSGSISEIAFHPTFPSILVAAGSVAFGSETGGVYRSADRGATWVLSTDGITAADLVSVAVDPGNPLRLYVGTASGALLYSHDGGAAWSRAFDALSPSTYSFGFSTEDVAVDPGNGQWVFLAAQSLWASNDGGVSFGVITEGDWAECVAVAPGPTSAVFVGQALGGGVLKGSPSGPWLPANTGLPICFGDTICTVSDLAVAPGEPLVVWGGTEGGGGVVRTTDGGDNWEVRGLTQEFQVGAVAVSPRDSSVVIAGASERIYKTTNGGTTWLQKHVAGDVIGEILYHPGEDQWIYAATGGSGVLRSTDGGETWGSFSTGIFSPDVRGLTVSREAEALLLAATEGSGLYGRELALGPSAIFVDGFESGDTTLWSATLP